MARPGRLDRRITIQQFTESRGATGQVLKTWTDLITVWAEKREKGGREFFTSDQRTAEASTIFVIRYRSDITKKMRVVYNSVNYDIVATRELGRTHWLELICDATVD